MTKLPSPCIFPHTCSVILAPRPFPNRETLAVSGGGGGAIWRPGARKACERADAHEREAAGGPRRCGPHGQPGVREREAGRQAAAGAAEGRAGGGEGARQRANMRLAVAAWVRVRVLAVPRPSRLGTSTWRRQHGLAHRHSPSLA
jgi:hypothetical protein